MTLIGDKNIACLRIGFLVFQTGYLLITITHRDNNYSWSDLFNFSEYENK